MLVRLFRGASTAQRATAAVFVVLIGAASAGYAQRGGAFRGLPIATRDSFDGAFNFCRVAFRGIQGGDGGGWLTDYPDADLNLSTRLAELTKTPISIDTRTRQPRHLVVQLTDHALDWVARVYSSKYGSVSFRQVGAVVCVPVSAGMRNRLGVVFHLLISLVVGSAARITAQPLVVTMTPDRIDEALRLAADETMASRFLDAYAVQTRAGWGNGPLIGRFTTPFARVVGAALAARQQGRSFSTTDVVPELIAPELHVVAMSQVAAGDSAMMATVQSVVLTRRANKNPTDVVAPLRSTELTPQYQQLTGTVFRGSGVVAVFALGALEPNTEIRVVFDRTARGFSGLSMCRECVVPLDISRLR